MRNKAFTVSRSLAVSLAVSRSSAGRPHTGRMLTIAALAAAFAMTAGCSSEPQRSAGTTPQTSNADQRDQTSDATLAARVKAALSADPELRPLPVSVATFRGVVQLAGYVDSETQIQKAVALARSVKGVQSVSNELHLRAQ
jgi:hyperosmotically inducible periplasmic protein